MSGDPAHPSGGVADGDGGSGRAAGLVAESLGGLLERFAGEDPLPAGGSAAAVATALAAAVAEMVADRAGRAEAATVLGRLRRRAVELADEDAEAYEQVVAASALPQDHPDRAARLRAALSAAGAPPVELAEVAAQVAVLAEQLGATSRRDLRGDATVSATLAAGAAAGAATLARLDLQEDDERVVRTESHARRARGAADRLRER